MGVFIFIALCVIGFAIYAKKINDEHKKKQREERLAEQRRLESERRMEEFRREQEKRERLERMWPRKAELDETINQVADWSVNVCKSIGDFLTKDYSPTTIINGKLYAVKDKTYYDINTKLTNDINFLNRHFSAAKKNYDSFIREFPEVNMNDEISDAEKKFSRAKEARVAFNTFSMRMSEFSPSSKMMNENSYGNINSAYWNQVRGMVRADAVRYVASCDEYTGHGFIDKIYTIDIEKLLRCVWYFATEKPFSASDFQKSTSVFYRIYKQSHADIFIANLYAKNNVGGENAIREYVRNIPDTLLSSHIASSLMWMNAYQTELAVLQRMLSVGIEMTAKMQERLHSLSIGGGKIPSGFDVNSSEDAFYFDASALAWKDDEYAGLFDNLAFKDKILTYSLAVREENKELFIPQGINLPGTNGIVNKINTVFSEEYGTSVTVRSANCIALSGDGEEDMEGVLVSAGECKQMCILMYMARIGKKLIIRFYTLFMPTDSNLAMQKRQALSLYKKLSPSVTMWESSLKDMMLMSVEQILNSSVQINDAPTATATAEIGNEPIF